MLIIPPGLTFFPCTTKQVCSADLLWNSWGGLSVHEPRTGPFEFPKLASSPWRCSTALLQNYRPAPAPLRVTRHAPLFALGNHAPMRVAGVVRVGRARAAAEPHHGIPVRAPLPRRDQRPPLARVAVSVSHGNLSPRLAVVHRTYRACPTARFDARAPNPPDLALLHRARPPALLKCFIRD